MSDDLTVLAVSLYPTTVKAIDDEVEREQQRIGGDYSREKFIRQAINEQLERADKERWMDT